jgi:hypothetical protein
MGRIGRRGDTGFEGGEGGGEGGGAVFSSLHLFIIQIPGGERPSCLGLEFGPE